MVYCRLVWVVLWILPLFVSADLSSNLLPGGEMVQQSNGKTIQSHLLITGPIGRVNTRLVPKASQSVQGAKSSKTFKMPQAASTKDIFQQARNGLLKDHQIIFECSGRDCGASNYWANSVFKRSILYGPEEYQRYLLAWNSVASMYTILYVAQRGTGQIYAHIETMTSASGPSGLVGSAAIIDSRSISSELKQKGKFIFALEPGEPLVDAIFLVLEDAGPVNFLVVAHDQLHSDETMSAGIERTRAIAEKISNNLVEKGISSTRLIPLGAGPMSPLDRRRTGRIELVEVIN